MGKIKNKNWRLHGTAPQRQFLENVIHLGKCTLKPGLAKSGSKLFENVEIPVEALKHQTSLHNLSESAKSQTAVISNQHASKIRLRRKGLGISPRYAKIQEMMKRAEKFQKQKKYGTLADFDSLNEALPTLQELTDLTKLHKDRRDPYKSGRPNSFKRLDQEMVNAVETFQAVVNDESYKADPFNAISMHIKQRMEAEKQEK